MCLIFIAVLWYKNAMLRLHLLDIGDNALLAIAFYYRTQSLINIACFARNDNSFWIID
jgi:hypothetical protein